MNIALIVIAIRKFMFFMTVFKSFGTMIRLVEKTFVAIVDFVLYFILMIVACSILIKIIGYDIGDTNYKVDLKTGEQEEIFESKSGNLLYYFVHTFLNSVGGIEEPNDDMWHNILDNSIYTTKLGK